MSTATPRPPKVPPPWFVHTAWRAHRALYRLSGGRFLWTTSNKRGWGALSLTTIGRKSGQGRGVIIGYVEDGPNLVAIAMNGWDEGHPSWWLNLKAHPNAVVVGRPGSAPGARAPGPRAGTRSSVAALGHGRPAARCICRPAIDGDARRRPRTARRGRVTPGDERRAGPRLPLVHQPMAPSWRTRSSTRPATRRAPKNQKVSGNGAQESLHLLLDLDASSAPNTLPLPTVPGSSCYRLRRT